MARALTCCFFEVSKTMVALFLRSPAFVPLPYFFWTCGLSFVSIVTILFNLYSTADFLTVHLYPQMMLQLANSKSSYVLAFLDLTVDPCYSFATGMLNPLQFQLLSSHWFYELSVSTCCLFCCFQVSERPYYFLCSFCTKADNCRQCSCHQSSPYLLVFCGVFLWGSNLSSSFIAQITPS